MSEINFFALEAPLLERLAQFLPDHEIQTAPDSEDAIEWSINPPGIFLIPGGELIDPPPQSRSVIKIRQRWIAASVTRNVSQAQTGKAAREEAGRSVWAIHRALNGWKPEAEKIAEAPTFEYSPLVRISGAGPVYDNGLLYYPVTFETVFALKGN